MQLTRPGVVFVENAKPFARALEQVDFGDAIVLTAVFEPHLLTERLIAGAAAGGFLLVAVLAYPAGMGMGDAKLAAVMGLVLGSSVAPAMLIALVTGTVVGAVVIARKGVNEGRKTAIPFGPFLAFGSVTALFA